MRNYLPYGENLVEGQGPNNWNHNGNFSVTPRNLIISPPEGYVTIIHRLRFALRDDAQFSLETQFGSIMGGLVNGIRVYAERETSPGSGVYSILREFTANRPIRNNFDMVFYGSQDSPIDFGAGVRNLRIIIDGLDFGIEQGSRLRVELADDFSPLSELSFRVVGELWQRDQTTLAQRQLKAII